MSKIGFDIEDASDNLVPVESGGEVKLDELKPLNGRVWNVGQPDPHDSIQPVEGGTVASIQGECRRAVESPAQGAVSSRRISWEIAEVLVRLIPAVVVIVLVFLAFGFVLVVNHDVEQNKLDLRAYVETVGWIVGVLLSTVGGGLVLKNRSDKAKQGGGSG